MIEVGFYITRIAKLDFQLLFLIKYFAFNAPLYAFLKT